MEFDGYRGADDVEEEVRNVGEGTDLFTHYAIGLPILMRIFSYLDVHSLRRVVLVNRAWYGHNKDRLTESHDVERSLHVCDYLSYVVQSHIKELKLKDQAYIAAKKNKACPPATNDPSWFCQKNASLFTSDPLVEYNPTDNTIDYVNATIDLLRQYLKLQAVRQQQKKRMGLNDKEEQERRAFLTQLLKIMNTQLRDTILALSDILSGRTKWNSNFEIFELSIRRYYEQLRVLFPAKPSSPGPLSASPARKRASPTAIISDPQARLIWQMRVGSDKYSCEFERFYELVIEREFLSVTSEKMKQDLYYYFNYFLNFPRDNMVTTYKWEVLTRLFGPYHEFIENFSNYVLGSGFLGLINRHHAEEILENHPEAVLMRFSRTYPTCLAFSFRKKDGKYDHYTNNPVWHGYPPFKGTRPKEETKSNIPIKEFLEKVFLQKGYELLPLRIDGKSVAAKGTASKYAQVADPYLDTDNFEAEEELSDHHRAPASHPTSPASWGGYKNSAASPSSSFSERSGFGGGAYLADSDSSPSTARKGSPQGEESQSPWSSPLPKSFAPASPSARRQAAVRQPQLDNYVEDSIMNDNSPASLLPPPSSFTSISPSSSPARSTGFRDNQFSSSPSPSPYSDVFEYQRQNGPQQQRERGGSSGGGTRPVPIVQTTFHGPTTSQSPQESCFYLDGASVKEELERNDPSSSRPVARLGGTSPIKSKRAESFQENYLDDVVFVEDEDDRDDPAVRRSGPNPSPPVAVAAATTPAFREYAAGQRATADPRQRQTITVAVTTTTGVSGVYIGGGEELATSAAQQDRLMMEALLKGGRSGSGGVAARDKAEREREERELREKRREERERAKKEFELNAYAYERDGDIHFVDEDEAFRTSAPAKNDDAFEASKADKEYEEPERYARASAQLAPSLLLAKQKAADELVDDSILAAILSQQQQGDAYASSTVDQTREAREQQEREEREEREREERRREREEKRREKEERRREKEERRKRKEERRAKKEEKRLKAQEEFAAAATSYGGDASISSGYFAEDEILPVHSPRRSGGTQQQQNAQWDEYFLDEQKPGVKLEQASAVSQGEEWAAEAVVDDEAMMAAILGESGAKQPPAKAKEQAPAAEGVSPYDEPFDDSFEEATNGKESESDSESEGEQERERELEQEKAEQRKRRDEEENERARQRQEEQEALAKKNEEKERKEREEQRAQLEEKKTAEARQKEGFVLPYAELTSTDRELLPRYVDRSKLESYLSDEEFKLVFGCPRNVFYTYKVWRQQQIKKNAGLF